MDAIYRQKKFLTSIWAISIVKFDFTNIQFLLSVNQHLFFFYFLFHHYHSYCNIDSISILLFYANVEDAVKTVQLHSRTREWCNNRSHIRLYITRVPREMDIHIKLPFQYAVCKPPGYRSEILTVQLVHARSRFAAFQWMQFDSRRMACQNLFNVVIENWEFRGGLKNMEKLWSFLFKFEVVLFLCFYTKYQLSFSGMKIKLFQHNI